tara:strand:- start:9619 stop:10269 length:651 start_codon:yes stop_codon:yes gene_type:complete
MAKVQQIKQPQQVAPAPKGTTSRSYYLYEILDTLGGSATLEEIYAMCAGSDIQAPASLQQLRDWISSSCVSKGYFSRQDTKGVTNYKLSSIEDYQRITAHNKAMNLAWQKRKKARKSAIKKRSATMAAKKKAQQYIKDTYVLSQQKKAYESEELARAIMPPRAPNPTKPTGRPVGRPSKAKPTPMPLKNDFIQQYVGALLGTTTAIALFFVMLKMV